MMNNLIENAGWRQGKNDLRVAEVYRDGDGSYSYFSSRQQSRVRQIYRTELPPEDEMKLNEYFFKIQASWDSSMVMA